MVREQSKGAKGAFKSISRRVSYVFLFCRLFMAIFGLRACPSADQTKDNRRQGPTDPVPLRWLHQRIIGHTLNRRGRHTSSALTSAGVQVNLMSTPLSIPKETRPCVP